MAGTYQVQPNGAAPKGLKAGDKVVTAGGTYTIKSVNADGSYNSAKTSDTTTSTYTGSYSNTGASGSTAGKTSASQAAAQAASTAAKASTPSTKSSGRSVTTSTNPSTTGYSASQAAKDAVAKATQNLAPKPTATVSGSGASSAAIRAVNNAVAAKNNAAVQTPAVQPMGSPSGYVAQGTYEDADIRAEGNGDYIDYQKAMYTRYQEMRDAALASGNTALAAEYAMKMREAHDNAELYRAQYGYSGGEDGSQKIPTPKNTPVQNWSVDYLGTTPGVQTTEALTLTNIDLELLSPAQQAVVLQAKKDYMASLAAGDTDGMARANQVANDTRAQAGYTMGADGDSFAWLTKPEEEKNTLFQQTIQPYQAQIEAANQVYDKLNDATLAQLLAAYNNSRAESEYQMGKLPAIYQQQRNATSADNEREKMAFREQAAASGMNAGNRSQAALAYSNQLQNSLGQLNTAEANALANAQHDLAQLYTSYQQQIAEAVANNNYQRAGELMAEMRAQAQSVADASMQQAQMNIQTAQLNENVRQNNIAQKNQEWLQNFNVAEATAGIGGYGPLGSMAGLSPIDIANLQRDYKVLQLGQYYPILRGYL